VVIYNFPGVCNGVDIDSDTITEIVRASAAVSPKARSNVVGVKLTCAQVGKITRLTALFGSDEFSVFGGQADFLIGGLSVGSAGCIAAFANIAPKTIMRIYRLHKEGKVEEALALHRKAALGSQPPSLPLQFPRPLGRGLRMQRISSNLGRRTKRRKEQLRRALGT
jgi:dihydrodipicolinate synthase/N-acetylneuraminate lyase